MLKAQKEIREAKAENDRLQTLWLESQKDLLKSKGAVNKLNTDNSYLRTQLGITETVRNNTTDAIAEAKKEAIDHKMEASKLFGELKKLQPIIEELRERNRVLETQLIEANIRFEEANVNATTSSHMLKTEVRRLYEDRRDLRQARMLDERNTSAIERKYIVAKEMVEKVKQEKYELQKANYELRTRAEDLEKRFVEAKLQLKRFADAATRHVGELANRYYVRAEDASLMKRSVLGWIIQDLATVRLRLLRSTPVEMVDPSIEKRHGTPVSNTSGKIPRKIQQETIKLLTDIKELHLKIDSLTSEQTFLLNENQVLKRNLEQITKTIDDVERKLTAKDIKVKRLENENRNHVETNKVLSSRIARAEKVAAYIERQFKEAKPNIKIDYTILGEVEPSTQLLAALLSGVTEANL
ncbi:hypothetical protein BJ742DRAFT_683908 [Cladochytrium replicatum]|nr:hypothetical protein BJ742DRAFT_683908 [Cladochytrium replicatum]